MTMKLYTYDPAPIAHQLYLTQMNFSGLKG